MLCSNDLQREEAHGKARMIAAAVIFGVTYLFIASGKIPHAVIVMVGASLMVLIGVLNSEEAFSHIDLSVILLLAGMMVLADIIARTGAFDWAAIQGVRLVRGHGFSVLVLLSLITAVASAFLDNVTTVVIMVPITLSLTRSLDLPIFPFLISEIFASNIGGSATIVGDPPNIIVASAGDIGFVEFLINIVPVSAASMVVLIILMFIWFRNDVRASDDKRREILERSPGDAIRDRGLLWKSIGVFALTAVGFMVHSLLDVSPAFIAMAGAGLLLLISRLEPGDVLRGVEWSTLTFSQACS